MKLLTILSTCLLLMTAASAAVDPSTTTYTTESHTLGTWDRQNASTMKALTTNKQLVFEGMTLAQLAANSDLTTGYGFQSFMCGGWVGNKSPCYATKVAFHRNADEEVQFGVASFAYWDNCGANNCSTKCVVVEFTDGEGGVYARALAARYVSNKWSMESEFFTLAQDGAITYKQSQGTLAQSYTANGYGLCGLITAPFIPSSAATTVWKNPAGEAVLTLDDIAEHLITARMAGNSVGLASDTAVECNRYESRDGQGHLTLLRLEMQMLDDKYVKCAVLELTNAGDGVAARVVKGAYKGTANGAYVGMKFINSHATYNPNDKSSYNADGISNPATSFSTVGYGLYALTATPQPSVELVLDRSKTWTELVDGVDVSDRSVTLKLRAPAADAVLTFDQEIAYDKLVVIPSAQQSNFFQAVDVMPADKVTFGQIVVNSGLRLQLPAAFNVGEIAVDAGSTLVYAGGSAEAPVRVNACITGGGGVEVASGTVVLGNSTSTYVGGTRVKNGATLVPGAEVRNPNAALWTSVFGTVAAANLVTIETGGKVDIAGQKSAGGYFALAGADQIVNTSADPGTDAYGLWGFSLTDNAELSFIDNPFHFISGNVAATIGLGAYTFTKKGANTVCFWSPGGTTVNGAGTIELAEGTLDIDKGGFLAANATLHVGTNTTLRVGGSAVSAKNVVVDGLVEFKGNAIASLSGLMSGTGVVRKVGAEWTSTVQINNGSRLRYEVTGGVMKVGSCTLASPDNGYYAFNTPGEPIKNVAVTVSGTGTFDFGGVKSCTPACTIVGNGYSGKWGALCNTGVDLPLVNQQMVQLTLAGDAQVGGVADKGSFGLLAPSYRPTLLELGEHTMTIVKTNSFYLVNTTITGSGKIQVQQGTLKLFKTRSAGEDYTLEIGEKGVLEMGTPLTVGSLINHGTITGAEAVTVMDKVTTTTNTIPYMVLAKGAMVKVVDGHTPLKSDALVLNESVTVDVDGIIPGEDGCSDKVTLFDVPASTVVSRVKFNMANLEPGVTASFGGGLPVLLRSGLLIIFH